MLEEEEGSRYSNGISLSISMRKISIKRAATIVIPLEGRNSTTKKKKTDLITTSEIHLIEMSPYREILTTIQSLRLKTLSTPAATIL